MRHGAWQERVLFATFRSEGGMDMNIYVGNLPWETTDEDLKKVFEKFGEVTRVAVIRDRLSGRSKGFGFVDMASDETGINAIEEMNGKEVGGRVLKVSKATPKADNRKK